MRNYGATPNTIMTKPLLIICLRLTSLLSARLGACVTKRVTSQVARAVGSRAQRRTLFAISRCVSTFGWPSSPEPKRQPANASPIRLGLHTFGRDVPDLGNWLLFSAPISRHHDGASNKSLDASRLDRMSFARPGCLYNRSRTFGCRSDLNGSPICGLGHLGSEMLKPSKSAIAVGTGFVIAAAALIFLFAGAKH